MNRSMNVMKTPRSLEIAITSRCNLKCKYCSHFTSAGDVDNDLQTDEWLRFFEELNECSVMDVTIEGGEPLIREDIKEIIEGIVRNRMRFGILSNGTLITDEFAAFLAKTNRLNVFQVSIDGSTPAMHEYCRGESSFRKAIDGVAILKKYEIPLAVRVTIHKHNFQYLDEIAEFLLEDIGLDGFSTNAASYMGLCRSNADDVQLSIEDRSKALEALLKLDRKYDGRIDADAGPLADIRTWIGWKQAKKENNKELYYDGGFLTGCGGVMSKLGVRADGVIVPCIQLSHIELGHINKDSLKEIWQHHILLNRLRDRVNIPLSDFAFCRDCEYMEYCTGNCPALSYTIAGDENRPSPDACLKLFLEEGGVLPDEWM